MMSVTERLENGVTPQQTADVLRPVSGREHDLAVQAHEVLAVTR